MGIRIIVMIFYLPIFTYRIYIIYVQIENKMYVLLLLLPHPAVALGGNLERQQDQFVISTSECFYMVRSQLNPSNNRLS